MYIEMFYLNATEQLFPSVEQVDQLQVCLPYSRLLDGIPILTVFQNLRWSSNKTSLSMIFQKQFDHASDEPENKLGLAFS